MKKNYSKKYGLNTSRTYTFNSGEHRRLNFILMAVIVLVLLGGGLFYFNKWRNRTISWEECISAFGSKVMYSYPGRCVTVDGRSVIQPISEDEKNRTLKSPPISQRPAETSGSVKTCSSDNDCGLLICMGCANTQYMEDKGISDLPCRTYATGSWKCECVSNVCQTERN